MGKTQRRISGVRTTCQGLAVLLLAALCTAVGAAAAQASAAVSSVYRYVDERGVVHFSDVPVRQRQLRDRSQATAGVTAAPAPRPAPVLHRTTHRRPPRNDGYDEMIHQVAVRYRVRPALVKAVVAAESNFDPGAISRAGAQGLMQLMPDTARQLGVQDPMRPEENLSGGVRYLREMLERYGDLSHALAAYNAGPTAVDRYRGIPPYPETQAYVQRVLNYYRGYHGDFRR